MKEMENQIGKIIKESRLADENVLVDEQFSEMLKTELLNNYISLQKSKMEKIKTFLKSTQGKIVAALSVVLILFLGYIVTNALISGGSDNGSKTIVTEGDSVNVTTEDQQVTKLAGMVILTESEVSLKDDVAGGDWYVASDGETVREGFRVKTGDGSKAVVALDDGSAIRLNENTEIYLSSLESNKIVVDQVNGQSYHRVEKDDSREYIVTNVNDNEDFSVTALGTAFDVSLQDKTIKCLESKVVVQYSKNKPGELVEEGEELVIGDDEGEVKGIDGEDLDNDWYEFNKEKDKEAQVDLGVFEDDEAPAVEIVSPANKLETKESSVTVVGETEAENSVKLKIRDEWYQVTNNNGRFEKNVKLAIGKNTIYVKAYSPAGVRTLETLVVYRVSETEGDIPEPPAGDDGDDGETGTFRITSVSSPEPATIRVNWEMTGYEQKAFKVVFSRDANPTYPGNNKYIGDGNSRGVTFDHQALEAGGLFHVRVCRYTGSGCDIYTQDVTVNVAQLPVSEQTVIEITSVEVNGNVATVNWEVTNGEAPSGFKVVWSTEQNPTYPPGIWQNSSTRSYAINIPVNEEGKYYVRIARWTGTGADSYSAQWDFTIAE